MGQAPVQYDEINVAGLAACQGSRSVVHALHTVAFELQKRHQVIARMRVIFSDQNERGPGSIGPLLRKNIIAIGLANSLTMYLAYVKEILDNLNAPLEIACKAGGTSPAAPALVVHFTSPCED